MTISKTLESALVAFDALHVNGVKPKTKLPLPKEIGRAVTVAAIAADGKRETLAALAAKPGIGTRTKRTGTADGDSTNQQFGAAAQSVVTSAYKIVDSLGAQ